MKRGFPGADVLVLGPQARHPNLREALRDAGIAGALVAVTAGWQEREGELEPLEEHLGQRVQDLRLYARTESVLAQHAALHAAYRQRQADLRELQDAYRLRLDHAKAAARETLALTLDTPLTRWARRDAIAALRRLDAAHLAMIARIHERFANDWQHVLVPLLAPHREELQRLVGQVAAVCIAGGHVAVLLNRLRLFGVADWLHGRTVVAWSAGAMCLTDRVVLFHDHPPQGAGNAEVFEAGLGLVRNTVLLPGASTRLALADTVRVSLLARRFAPADCLAFDEGGVLRWRGGQLHAASGIVRLRRAGGTEPLAGATG
jgi:hypothetical protein